MVDAPAIRNRIKDHRRVRAGDLIPHELNFRTHPDAQRKALVGMYAEVGFARSLLAFELPDGRLKLIDGHMRRDVDPDMLVDVEVLDVTESEALALLAAIDPMVGMATSDQSALTDLLSSIGTASSTVADLFAAAVPAPLAASPAYSPVLEPTAATVEVTVEDMAKAAEAMQAKLEPNKVLYPATCPECGEEFFVDPDQRVDG